MEEQDTDTIIDLNREQGPVRGIKYFYIII